MTTAARRLPLLEARRAELELCAYCPKLCRAACPVSNAEPREVLIPWGKMTTAYFMARGMAPADAPRYVVAVFAHTMHGGGGTIAAPVFKDLMTFTLGHFQVPPTGTPPPAFKVYP